MLIKDSDIDFYKMINNVVDPVNLIELVKYSSKSS